MAYNISSSTAESVLKDSYTMNINPPPGLTRPTQYQSLNQYQPVRQSPYQSHHQSPHQLPHQLPYQLPYQLPHQLSHQLPNQTYYHQPIKPTIQVSELENQFVNTNKPMIYVPPNVPIPGSVANVSDSLLYPPVNEKPQIEKTPVEPTSKEPTQFEKELIEVLVNFKTKIDSFDQFKTNVETQIGAINDRINKLTDLVITLHTEIIKIDANVNKEENKTIDRVIEVSKGDGKSTIPSEELIEEVYMLLSNETKPMLLNTMRSKLPKKVLPEAGLRGFFKQLIDNIPGIKKIIEKRVDSIGEIREEYLYYIYDNENKIEGFNKICKSGKPCKLSKKGECSFYK